MSFAARAGANGGAVSKAAVVTPAKDGHTNTAFVALLTKAQRVPKSACRVVASAAERRETLSLEGDPANQFDRMIPRLAPGVFR